MAISLPPDLLFIIFRLASAIDVAHHSTNPIDCLPSALATYALVNKNWHDVAQHELYTRLYLRPSTHADTLMLLLRTLETTPALASRTHVLSYSAYALARGDTCTLARILQRCSTRLEHLSLHGWAAAPDERVALHTALASCTRLRTLTLANGASAAPLCDLPAFLATAQRWPQIEALSLGANCVHIPTTATTSASASALACACPRLVRWEFRADAGTADADILPPAGLAPRLSVLVLRGGALRTSAALAPALEAWSGHLTHLAVQCPVPTAVADASLATLARFRRLRTLRIPSAYLRPGDLARAGGFVALEELQYKLEARELPLLAAALRGRVQGWGALPVLKTLTVCPAYGVRRGFEVGLIRELVEVCAEKGIKLAVGNCGGAFDGCLEAKQA